MKGEQNDEVRRASDDVLQQASRSDLPAGFRQFPVGAAVLIRTLLRLAGQLFFQAAFGDFQKRGPLGVAPFLLGGRSVGAGRNLVLFHHFKINEF